jgi:hypothetical protein
MWGGGLKWKVPVPYGNVFVRNGRQRYRDTVFVGTVISEQLGTMYHCTILIYRTD